MDAWNLSSSYTAYITSPGVVFAGTLDQIMSKMDCSWSAASEAWFRLEKNRITSLPGVSVKTRIATEILLWAE